jgi:TolB-like protein
MMCGRKYAIGIRRSTRLETGDFMNRNVFILLGMALVFHLGGCITVGKANRNTENQSVIVRRMDNKGEESVRIYIDGKRVGRLSNGGIEKYDISEGTHSIYANYDGDEDKNSEILYFTANNNVCNFSVEVMFNERNRYSGIRITKEDAEENKPGKPGDTFAVDKAIAKSFNAISGDIPEKAIVAIANISSEGAKAGEYVIEELTVLFVNSRKYDVVDRRSLDLIRDEQNFQITGAVDDDSIIKIGHMLGAGVVITGSLDQDGSRLRLKALDVETAKILAVSSETL